MTRQSGILFHLAEGAVLGLGALVYTVSPAIYENCHDRRLMPVC